MGGSGTWEHGWREADTGVGIGDGTLYVSTSTMKNFVIHSALVKFKKDKDAQSLAQANPLNLHQ